MSTAIVLGATGLVGGELVKLLLADDRFDKVKVFVRHSTELRAPKLEEHIVNFDQPDTWRALVKGNVLFSALGTTIGKAGSKEAQYKVDYTYQYQMAEIAADNGCTTYALVSAAWSSPDSKIFYSRMKGELERDVQKLPFQNIHIIRPGALTGDRKEKRTGEIISVGIMNIISRIPGLHQLKPIHGKEVGQALINASLKEGHGIHTYTLGEVFKLAEGRL